MTQIEAVYDNGVFRPLQPVDCPERQKVTVTIPDDAGAFDQVQFAIAPDRWQALCEALDAPPRAIPALRKLLTDEGVFDGPAAAAG